jgi:predicted GTPase
MPNESYRLLGEERSIVSDVAGTTRDAVDALLHRGNATYRFVDTAGVRKRGKVEYGPEFFMVNRLVGQTWCVAVSGHIWQGCAAALVESACCVT